MFPLQCTVRDCDHLLRLSDDGLTCPDRHHFDRAKGGYWNLLQPQDRRSKSPGDHEDAVMARHRWLQRGYADGLIECLRPWIDQTAESSGGSTPKTLDLGCGEGSFGPSLYAAEADGYCGIDLSKRAIKLAARNWPAATWVLANADRRLPAADDSVDRVMSLFGRRPASEVARVLVPGGLCMVAVPGEDDLIELRAQAQQAGHRRDRRDSVANELLAVGLECVEQRCWRTTIELDQDAIADAMAMTYRAVRRSQKERLENLDRCNVTLAADLFLFRKKS